MRRAGLGLAVALLLGSMSAPAGSAPGAALSEAGAKAFELARASDDRAGAAKDEGEQLFADLKALLGEEAESGAALRGIREKAEPARQALAGYRTQAQISATEALDLLTQVSRLAAAPKPDPVRREVLEQRALLAASEAAVMAARAQTEAERLRALLAETRLVLAGAKSGGASPGASTSAAARAPAGEGSGREVVVPNVVGARLPEATRDLEGAGLRLGATTGPHDGYVVKQVPEAGTRAPRQAAVGVTLSATAATVVSP